MKVRVQLFAVAKELAGRDYVSLDLPEGCTIGQLRARLADDVPSLAAVLPQVLFAVGSEYTPDEQAIEGNEVACIPPVSGG